MSLEEMDFIQEKTIHSYSIWGQTNDVPCMLTIFGQRDAHLPRNDKLKASLLHCDKESLQRKSFCPGTVHPQTAVLLAPQLR